MFIGEKIKNIREDKDMSQLEVANLIPMNQSNYSKIERDLQEPSLDQLCRICQILDIDVRYLLGLDGKRQISQAEAALLADIKEFIRRHKDI